MCYRLTKFYVTFFWIFDDTSQFWIPPETHDPSLCDTPDDICPAILMIFLSCCANFSMWFVQMINLTFQCMRAREIERGSYFQAMLQLARDFASLYFLFLLGHIHYQSHLFNVPVDMFSAFSPLKWAYTFMRSIVNIPKGFSLSTVE